LDDPKKLKRQKIIEIAAKEFAEKGYDAANINEIAALSGIGKGSIYLYFKTKKELFLATMETVVEKFNEISDAVMDLDCSLMDKLKLCLEYLLTQLSQ
jgi:TetR/AcrR family fatty acid metabolism transcriptional regulator